MVHCIYNIYYRWFYFKDEHYDSPLNVVNNAKLSLIKTLSFQYKDYINALKRYYSLPSDPINSSKTFNSIELFQGLSAFENQLLPCFDELPLKLQHKLLFDSDILTP